MSINVPAEYEKFVVNAAKKLGIPTEVVAAQINEESGFQPGVVSSAGAEGIAQFEPGTFAEYGHGSPFNVADAFGAYEAYMGALLRQYHGNVDNALAAYNAGTASSSAGQGYAHTILSAAGQGYTITSGKSGSGSSGGGGDTASANVYGATVGILKGLFPGLSWGGAASEATSLDSVGAGIAALAGEFQAVSKAVTWLSVPSNEVRIVCGVFGFAAFSYGVVLLAREARS